jgi:hypothetical protein
MLPNNKKTQSNNQSNRNPQLMPNSANIPKGKIPRQDLIYCKIKNKK